LLTYKQNIDKKLPFYSILFYIIISIFYGLLLSSWPNDFFKDRENYRRYAESFELLSNKYDSVVYFFNEPLFLFYNNFLSHFFAPEQVPQVSVFIIAATLAFFILKYARSYPMIFVGFGFLFFISYTFHLQLVVLRQGLATAFLLWFVCFFYEKKPFYPLCFLLSFFHISFLIVFFILFYEKVLSTRIKNLNLRMIFYFISLLIISFFMLKVASSLGIRQAEGEHLLNSSNGGGGFLLFGFVLLFFYLRGFGNVYKSAYGKIALLGVLAYLAFYFTIPISGRLISTYLPFFYIYVISCSSLKVYFAACIFFLVNLFLFTSSIAGGSLTTIGVNNLNYIFPF
jgi:hypothetical protein